MATEDVEEEIENTIDSFRNNKEENSLDFNGLDITDIPKHLFDLDLAERLFELMLDYNEIQCLPSTIKQLKNLTSLSLLGNSLSELPEEFGELQFLEKLSLNENQLTCLPDSFGELKSLRYLHLISNLIEYLPERLGNLENLEELYLDENKLSNLPNSFSNLKTLKILEIASNKLSILPNDFGKYFNIEILNLSSNELEHLPDTFGEIKNLKILDLSNNKIITLTEKCESWDTLEKLYLDGNVLSYLPEWFSNLPNLEEVNISDNTLSGEQITEQFCDSSTKLKSLECRFNFLSKLPENFGNLKKLHLIHFGSTYAELERSTFINGNWLKFLPDSFIQLTQLTKLHLDENQLTKLPERFGELKELTSLDLGQNMISCLPDSFCQLTKLEFLQLSKNKLEQLPNEFGNLISLVDLRLDHNHLSSIPDSMSKLSALESLDIFGNKLTELPIAILKLKNIKRLDLDGNMFQLKLSEIPRILPGMSYPSRDPLLKDNWRGKTRADKVKSTGKIIEVESCPDDASEDDGNGHVEDCIEWNENAWRAAIRHGASFWRSHNGPATRGATERSDDANIQRNVIDDDEWQGVTYNISRRRHLVIPNTKDKNPDEEDWDEEIEQINKYKETMATCDSRKNQTSNVINDFQNTINRYPPAAQAYSKTAYYDSFVYRKVEPVVRTRKENYRPLPGQFDDLE